MNNRELILESYFPVGVYLGHNEDYLVEARKVADKKLKGLKIEDDMFPVVQTESVVEELFPLATHIAQMSWDILKNQGYRVDSINTYLTEMWVQQFNYGGRHTEHAHGNSCQISGFYFIDVPKKSSFPFIHDPNHVKRYANLPEENERNITLATTTINYENIKEGDFVFFNSWLPHSFAPNRSRKPFRFIHFNVGVMPRQEQSSCPAPAEVI